MALIRTFTNNTPIEDIKIEDWRGSEVTKVIFDGVIKTDIKGLNEVRRMVLKKVSKKKLKSSVNCKTCLLSIKELCEKYNVPIRIYIKLDRIKQQQYNPITYEDEEEDENYEYNEDEEEETEDYEEEQTSKSFICKIFDFTRWIFGLFMLHIIFNIIWIIILMKISEILVPGSSEIFVPGSVIHELVEN
jgi:transcription elongation factor Elf1